MSSSERMAPALLPRSDGGAVSTWHGEVSVGERQYREPPVGAVERAGSSPISAPDEPHLGLPWVSLAVEGTAAPTAPYLCLAGEGHLVSAHVVRRKGR